MARIIVAAGGTGGHVYPAISLALVLRERGNEVVFLGGRRVESRLVPEAGFELHRLRTRGLPRALSVRAVLSGIALVYSVGGARRLLRRLRPDVLVGMGGYPSLAPALAAPRKLPVVLHEQNARLTLAHRLSLGRARALGLSLPLVVPARPGLRVEVVGNPLRPALRELACIDADERERRRSAARDALGLGDDRPVVLAFGGSQGALALNEALPPALRDRDDVRVLHVSGPAHADKTREAWGGAPHARVVPYVDAMEEAYAACDLVVSRSGASTVAELTALGLPSVLVPFPSGPYQRANASVLAEAGAASVVVQSSIRERLGTEVAALLDDQASRARMGEAARALGRPDSADRLADLVTEIARSVP